MLRVFFFSVSAVAFLWNALFSNIVYMLSPLSLHGKVIRHVNVFVVIIGCGHTWDLTLVKGFNRSKKDVKKLYYSKTH